MQDYNYPNIDMQGTGALLKKKVEEAGYTVRLLHVHMEELLVPESQIDIILNIEQRVPCVELTRMYSYLRRIQQVA